ncbi:coiled-coil domain-containing protein 113 [Chelonus insularis]|uniref:coiled-coil domain-containing protein 113 n=1 Tax=Chelonus insularis TaxID=460826 RepID=UPI00158BB054|nr:coiled-coil domain-containing protein 113-like [Chelonus insularis]
MSSITKMGGSSLLMPMSNVLENEPIYQNINTEELKDYLKDSIYINRILTLENEIFENFLVHNNPQALAIMTQTLETTKKVLSQKSHGSSCSSSNSSISHFYQLGQNIGGIKENSPMSPGKISNSSKSIKNIDSNENLSKSRIYPSVLSNYSSTKGFRITLSHRIEMTNKQIDEMKKQFIIREKQIGIKKMNLTAQLDEIELRIRDIEEVKKELEYIIQNKDAESTTKKILADKFIKYMKTWMKTVTHVMDKLRLKSYSIKSQIKKIQQQLRQREEFEQTFYVIDFEALTIENQDYLKKIKTTNKELINLKKVLGRYNLKLDHFRKKLEEQRNKIDNLEKEINIKENNIDKLKKDIELFKSKLENINQQKSKFLIDKELPDVIDFIKIQTELEEMKKTQKRIERHKNIQITALKTFKKRQMLLHE